MTLFVMILVLKWTLCMTLTAILKINQSRSNLYKTMNFKGFWIKSKTIVKILSNSTAKNKKSQTLLSKISISLSGTGANTQQKKSSCHSKRGLVPFWAASGTATGNISSRHTSREGFQLKSQFCRNQICPARNCQEVLECAPVEKACTMCLLLPSFFSF